MRQNSTYTFSRILIIALAVCLNYAFASGPSASKKDTIKYYLGSKSPKKKSPLTFSLPPIKPGVISSARVTVAQPGDKLLSNVEVFPNPITDQINLKYMVSRNSTVTVKLMDVLGNNVATLSSKAVEPGEQTLPPYSIKNNNISRGFYFIRVVAGTEVVIKRVSIL
jgi:hypothetical protein